MRSDVIVIGSGQAGVPLAARLAKAGRTVLLVEGGELGGTCVNDGCTPTKTMIASARAAHVARRAGRLGVRTGEVTVDVAAVVDRKDAIVRQWRQGVQKRLSGAGERLTLRRGRARFVGPREIEVAGERHAAETVVVNVGGRPAVPPLPWPRRDALARQPLRSCPSFLRYDRAQFKREVPMPRPRLVAVLPATLLSSVAALAQVSPDTGAACAFQEIDVDKYGRQPFRNPPVERAQGGHLKTILAVRYTDPATTRLGGCPVKLRTYNGHLVGPTLRLRPGDTLDLTLRNELPQEKPEEIAKQIEQEASQAHIETLPHSFNTTNLHTHGLHVSPVGNSDNVLLAIGPQTAFPYEIRVPANHPPGTFWYHAHTHGSTAIQVGSGMAGALVVEDDESTLPPALREATRREKVLVFQTILYDAEGKVDDITAFFPDGKESPANCKQGKSSCTWHSSKRRTTINGQIVPVIEMRPGEVQRWRLVDSAFRETINVRLEGHSLHEIALDGLYLGKIDTWSPAQSVELQPGYRSDVLVKASSQPGTYRLLDAASPAGVSLRGVDEAETVLAEVVVKGAPMDMPLPASDQMAALAPFPGVDLKSQAVGVQEAVFKLGQDLRPNGSRNYFQINYHAFNPSRIRYLQLGATDQWTLSTVGDPGQTTNIPPHVFHIHVNPFQAQRRDPSGQTQTVWKDTLLVPGGQSLNIYTRYLDYIGQFVMHCHILDHEDLGMMELVEVVGERPATSLPAHGPPH